MLVSASGRWNVIFEPPDVEARADTPRAQTMSRTLGTQVGERLKAARQRLGLSLRALGDQTGFSASFLSQVELGQTTPSLGSLQKISDALSVSLTSLLASDAERAPVLRRSSRAAVRSEWSKASMESLIPAGFDEQLGAVLLKLDATGRSGTTHYTAGKRVLAYCLQGAATLVFASGKSPIEIEAGDSIVLDGPESMCWENRAEHPSHVFVVVARVTA
jgi:transcriptional regulator with XRE-family HTH domain